MTDANPISHPTPYGKYILLDANKRPVEAWQRAPEPTNERIRRHMSAGGLLGWALPAGTVALDVDIHEDCNDRRRTYRNALTALRDAGILPDRHARATWRQQTRRGGRHFLFATNRPDLTQRNGLLSGPGWTVDTRIGGKGYIVLWSGVRPTPARVYSAPHGLIMQLSTGARPSLSANDELYSAEHDNTFDGIADDSTRYLQCETPTDRLSDEEFLAVVSSAVLALPTPTMGTGHYELWRDVGWALLDAADRRPALADRLEQLWIDWSTHGVPGAPSPDELREHWDRLAASTKNARRKSARATRGLGRLFWLAERTGGWRLTETLEARAKRTPDHDESSIHVGDVFISPACELDEAIADDVKRMVVDMLAILRAEQREIGHLYGMPNTPVISRARPTTPIWDPANWKELSGHEDPILQGLADRVCGPKTPVRKKMAAIRALIASNPVNLPQRWVESVDWDGIPRIDNWLVRIGATNDESTRYASKLLLLSMVGRILHPGCKVDEHVMLVGPGGIGKSLLGKALVPFVTWYGEFDPTARTDPRLELETLYGKCIVEMPEFRNMNPSHHTYLKSWLTTTQFRVRPAFREGTITVERNYAIYGTTNFKHSIMSMGDGGRRFVIVLINSTCLWYNVNGHYSLDVEWVARNRDQLVAEAKDWLTKRGYGVGSANKEWWLQEYVRMKPKDVAIEQHKRLAKNDCAIILETIKRHLGAREGIDISDLTKALSFHLGLTSPREERYLAQDLINIAHEYDLDARRTSKGTYKLCRILDDHIKERVLRSYKSVKAVRARVLEPNSEAFRYLIDVIKNALRMAP